MGRVSEKVVIVTGGASGLGEASSLYLAREGAVVVVADINRDLGEKVASACGPEAAFSRLDVCDEDAWRSLVADTTQRYSRLDVLVNNAGIVIPASIEDARLEDFRKIMAVNAEGVFLGCKHAIPAMAGGGGGSIINMSSIAGISGTPPFAAYSASKGAVRALTQTVAAHCRAAGNGVRCNSIHPAGMNTPMVQNLAAAAVAATGGQLPEASAVGFEIGEPEDVAAMVVYLASDESRFVNGAAMVIDNGLTAG